MTKLVTFTSPDYHAVLPPSQGGGPVVSQFEFSVFEEGGNADSPFGVVTVLREEVAPISPPTDPPSFSHSVTVPVAGVNKDCRIAVRESNPAHNQTGSWGAPSEPFYGGNLTLGACNVVSLA